jgi:hypothetical protein
MTCMRTDHTRPLPVFIRRLVITASPGVNHSLTTPLSAERYPSIDPDATCHSQSTRACLIPPRAVLRIRS